MTDDPLILVTGGAGVMGQALVAGLIKKGWKVRVFDQPGTAMERLDVDLRHGDITDLSTMEGLFDGVGTCFHLAAVLIAQDPEVFERVNVGGTRNIVEGAEAAGVRHFIFVSSASVVYLKTTQYSLSKRECERIVQSQASMHFTIVRPTLAYNEHGGQEFRMFLEFLRRFPIVPFVGGGEAKKRPVYVDDLVRGFLAIPGNAKAFEKTYNFSGGSTVSMREFAELTMRHHKIDKRILPIPVWLCRLVAAAMELTMKEPLLTWNGIAGVTQDAELDNASAREDLGYNPIGVREGFEKIWPLST